MAGAVQEPTDCPGELPARVRALHRTQPLRANLVQHAEDYPWSSYRHYVLGESNPLVDDDPYYVTLGPDPATRQQRYREFVSLNGPYDTVVDPALVETYF